MSLNGLSAWRASSRSAYWGTARLARGQRCRLCARGRPTAAVIKGHRIRAATPEASSQPLEIRPDLGAALAAFGINKFRLDVAQPDMIRPAVSIWL